MNKKVRNVVIVAAILVVCVLVGSVVDFFLRDALMASWDGSPMQDIWMYIATINISINWLLIGMFICIYIPCAVIGTKAVLSSPMAIFMLLPLLMVLMVSIILWPLMCLGVIIMIPTFID